MTKAQKETSATVNPATTAGITAAMAPWAVSGQFAAAWVEGVTRINSEWARFIADRLAKDAKVQHDLLACKSPVEAQQLGAEFMRCTLNDYLAETARLSSMGVKLAHDNGVDA